MKIGILTLTHTLNHGALFQAYALQECITSLGHTAEIINYKNTEIYSKEIVSFKGGIKNWKQFIKAIILHRKLTSKCKKFGRFEKKYLYMGKEMHDDLSIKEACTDYQAIVVGSDQVWNMKITHWDWHYFLDFCTERQRKIAYAPSFGNDSFPLNASEQASMLLRRFDSLSVREKSGQVIINDLTCKEVPVVLDPTLLLDKNIWIKHATFIPPISGYILVYFPHNKKSVFSFVGRLKKITGLPVIYLNISPKRKAGVKNIYDAAPEEFLGWIKHANFVVTGSFHGTIFSLIFEKQFFFEPISKAGVEGRIDNLVHLLGLENRNISNVDVNQAIDYSCANRQLDSLRNSSVTYLKNAINSVQ